MTVGPTVSNVPFIVPICSAANPDLEVEALAGHDVIVVPGAATQTFEHTYIYDPSWKRWWNFERQLRLAAEPGVTLSSEHVPWRCRLARVVLLGPLMPQDVDAASFKQTGLSRMLFPQKIGLMGQGYQRAADETGKIYSIPEAHPSFLAGLGPGVSAFLSDVETTPWTSPTAPTVATLTDTFVITRGGDGAIEYTSSGECIRHIPVVHVQNVVDTNGAGDTFATSYILAAAHGVRDPGAEAAVAAARAVTLQQACKPACVAVGLKGVVSLSEQSDGRAGFWLGEDQLGGVADQAGAWWRRVVDKCSIWWSEVTVAVYKLFESVFS